MAMRKLDNPYLQEILRYLLQQDDISPGGMTRWQTALDLIDRKLTRSEALSEDDINPGAAFLLLPINSAAGVVDEEGHLVVPTSATPPNTIFPVVSHPAPRKKKA